MSFEFFYTLASFYLYMKENFTKKVDILKIFGLNNSIIYMNKNHYCETL